MAFGIYAFVPVACWSRSWFVYATKETSAASFLWFSLSMLFKSPCKRTQHCWPTAPNIVGCYVSRRFARPVACCCELLRKVWTGQTFSQQRWELLRPFARNLTTSLMLKTMPERILCSQGRKSSVLEKVDEGWIIWFSSPKGVLPINYMNNDWRARHARMIGDHVVYSHKLLFGYAAILQWEARCWS